MLKRICVGWATVLVCAVCAAGQGPCEPQWVSEGGFQGTNGSVKTAVMWDPDGPGGSPELLVAGGAFKFSGDRIVNGVAAWNGLSWSPMGSGLVSSFSGFDAVERLFVWGTELYAAVSVTSPGPSAVVRVFRWDQTQWQQLGGVFNGQILGLEMFGGRLVVCGGFTTIDSAPVRWIAAWSGIQWQPLGGEGPVGSMADIALAPGGKLWGIGTFSVDGVLNVRIAQLDDSGWHFTPLGHVDVTSMARAPNGDIYVYGSLGTLGGTAPCCQRFARWNGATWQSMGTISARGPIGTGPGGLVVVCDSNMALNRWNGTAWQRVGTGWFTTQNVTSSGEVRALACAADGRVFSGGDFLLASGVLAANVAFWNGSDWQPMGRGISPAGYVQSICTTPSGDVYVGGYFHGVGGTRADLLAKRSGNQWVSVGGTWGFHESNRRIDSIASTAGSELIVGGYFRAVGAGVLSEGIARWTGSQWQDIRASTQVRHVVVRGNDQAIYAGSSGVFHRVGTQWVRISTLEPTAMARLADGSILMAGSAWGFMRWDGTAWSTFAPPPSPSATIAAIVQSPDGVVYAGLGSSVSNGAVIRWTHAGWTPLSGFRGVTTMSVRPSGELVVAGLFAGDVPLATSVRKWTGQQWERLGGNFDSEVWALGLTPEGDLLAGGQFTMPGSIVSPYLARWVERSARSIDGPQAVHACLGGNAQFQVAATGTGQLTYQWRRNGEALSNGTQASGAVVSGANGPVMNFSGLTAGDAGLLECVVTQNGNNACAIVSSSAALIVRVCACSVADIATENSGDPLAGPDGRVTPRDWEVFMTVFFQETRRSDGTLIADITDAKGIGDRDGFLTGADFDLFVQAYFAGCGGGDSAPQEPGTAIGESHGFDPK